MASPSPQKDTTVYLNAVLIIRTRTHCFNSTVASSWGNASARSLQTDASEHQDSQNATVSSLCFQVFYSVVSNHILLKFLPQENTVHPTDKGGFHHITGKLHRSICVYLQLLWKTKATYMEKWLDHFAWSTPCGREINHYKLLTSRLQFCLKFGL